MWSWLAKAFGLKLNVRGTIVALFVLWKCTTTALKWDRTIIIIIILIIIIIVRVIIIIIIIFIIIIIIIIAIIIIIIIFVIITIIIIVVIGDNNNNNRNNILLLRHNYFRSVESADFKTLMYYLLPLGHSISVSLEYIHTGPQSGTLVLTIMIMIM